MLQTHMGGGYHYRQSRDGVAHLVGSVDRALSFPSAEFVRRALRKAAAAAAPPLPLVLDATHVQAADFTAAKGIKSLIEDFHTRGQTIIFYNVKPSLAGVLRGVRPRAFLHARSRQQLDALLLQAARPRDRLSSGRPVRSPHVPK